MIEDMTHLTIIEAHKSEINSLISHHNSRTNGVVEKSDLTAHRLEFIKDLRELLHHQERALRFMRGEPVEPETLFAETVMTGFGGLAG